MRAIAIAGTHSGVGKTSIALGLMAALRRRGLKVQGFKVGPDFIDPGHHQLATGRISHNLDGWMLSKADNLALFAKYSRDCEVAIVEGVMGVFDGYGATSEAGSTAQMAKWLGIPALLVVDAGKMSRSVAALVSGYMHFDANLSITGICLNRIGTKSHERRLREAISTVSSVPVWGGIPKNSFPEIPSRHLGLWLAGEENLGVQYIDGLADAVERYLDVGGLLAALPEVDIPLETELPRRRKSSASLQLSASPKIAIARDEAFCFYYEENRQLLREAGATLVEVSPMRDRFPSDIDGFYFGGGYPELHASQLSENQGFLQGLRQFAEAGYPVYGECGGLIYLCRGIETRDGTPYPFAGILPFWTKMGDRAKLGYTEIQILDNAPFSQNMRSLKGHRFHYSEIIPESFDDNSLETCYLATSWRTGEFREGYRVGNTLASYVHLHFASHPEFARGFVAACARSS